jgi:transcriptional regulator NrdR family protein
LTPVEGSRTLRQAAFLLSSIRAAIDDTPIELQDVHEVAKQAREIVRRFRQDNADVIAAEVDHKLLREYNRRKLRAAARGAAVYWEAKSSFIQELLADWPRCRPPTSSRSRQLADADPCPLPRLARAPPATIIRHG